MSAIIKHVDYYLPSKTLTNAEMVAMNPDWQVDKITEKTGIYSRRYASSDEFSVDLGIQAAKKVLNDSNVNKDEIDFILFCTQTPKHLIPGSACLVHEALGFNANVGALDINLGCSGYVYSLMIADSLVSQRHARNVLLITADTYTKLIAKNDRKLLPLFGDGASASIITYQEGKKGISRFEYGTDGSGAEKLISQNAGLKGLVANEVYKPDLYMNGCAIFNFTLDAVPELVARLLKSTDLALEQIDHFIFHQANCFMLDHLKEKIGIPDEKFVVDVADIGNTVSSSIPIALSNALKSKRIKTGDKVMLVGFGVGLSWSACLIEY